MSVKFYDSVDDKLLKLAVIVSKSNGKWVFCKHKKRTTYEIPGGHREHGSETFGLLCYAEITTFGEIDSEIEKIVFLDDLSDNLNYPNIQPYLIKELQKRNVI